MEAAGIKEIFDSLYLSAKDLTAGQTDFVNGCRKQFARTRELSDRQVSVLLDIRRPIKDNCIRFTNKV